MATSDVSVSHTGLCCTLARPWPALCVPCSEIAYPVQRLIHKCYQTSILRRESSSVQITEQPELQSKYLEYYSVGREDVFERRCWQRRGIQTGPRTERREHPGALAGTQAELHEAEFEQRLSVRGGEDTKIINVCYYLQGPDGPGLTSSVEIVRSWSLARVLGVLCLYGQRQMEEGCPFSCLDRIDTGVGVGNK